MALASRARMALLGLFCAGTVGCGIGEGDYLVFRVGIERFTTAAACYFPNDEPPPNVIDDSDSHRVANTWVVYFAAGERVLLDMFSASLEGEETSEGFSFAGHTIDVSYLGADKQEAKLTRHTTVTVEMEVDGAAVQGTIVDRTALRCDFLTATPSDGLCEAVPDCEHRAAFAGVRLDDVTLRSGVDAPNPF
jgi:hypothetical protein